MISLTIGLVLALLVGAGALALYRRGVRRERNRQRAQEAQAYVETRQRMDAVDDDFVPAELRDWLRDRAGQSGGDL